VSGHDELAPPLIPSIPYDDAAAAIQWLTDVLGLCLIRKFEMADGEIKHAELAWQNAMVFVHSRRPGSQRVVSSSITWVGPDRTEPASALLPCQRQSRKTPQPMNDSGTPRGIA
jgi:uncharacterized glyoxalase superfamily protein PhnB